MNFVYRGDIIGQRQNLFDPLRLAQIRLQQALDDTDHII